MLSIHYRQLPDHTLPYPHHVDEFLGSIASRIEERMVEGGWDTIRDNREGQA